MAGYKVLVLIFDHDFNWLLGALANWNSWPHISDDRLT